MTGFDQLECFISVSHSYAAIATMKDAEIGGGGMTSTPELHNFVKLIEESKWILLILM